MSTIHAPLELIESMSSAVDNKKNIALEYSSTLKLSFRQYPEIHTNDIISNCTTL